jgi:molecular chaperone DnaK
VAERAIKDLGDKADASAKAEVENNIQAVRTAVEGTDTAKIQETTQALYKSAEKLGAAAYAQGGPQAGPNTGGSEGPGNSGGSGPADDGVVEGEFKEAS